ncbi:MAG: MBL fold metallo-hydrolase [Gammaproteobacteria bacterium]|jgi:metallo-beta-lactamase family protein
MPIEVQFHGAAEEVTGSCHLVTVGEKRLLLDCGLIQGRAKDEERNRKAFPFDPQSIDAVVLSHAHIDHSGRLPMLVKAGFTGSVYTHRASRDLCRIMLKDSAFLNEKDVEWENRKRLRKGLKPVEALYTVEDAQLAMSHFKGLVYDKKVRILPNVTLCLRDAGHILGSAIVELWLEDEGQTRKLVFSGDMGRPGMPILQDPTFIEQADLVIMESTYGDRLHRSWEETQAEIQNVVKNTSNSKGNILIPSFAVGRTQEILYMLARHYNDWHLDRWQVFLDSPLAIEATRIFTRHSDLFDKDMAELWTQNRADSILPNLHISRTSNQSIALNRVRSGAIIIAGSGMCSGGRIKQHLKHNIWRRECHVIITGFQARGTLGRTLVDGAKYIRLWGETVRVAATIHTIGGLSAHADRHGLQQWYAHFEGRPPVVLVHGETDALESLAGTLQNETGAPVTIAKRGQQIDLLKSH